MVKISDQAEIHFYADHKVVAHVNVFHQMAEELRSVGETQLLDLITSNIILTLPPSFYVFDTIEFHALSRQWST